MRESMKQRKSEINWKLVVRVACLMLLDVVLLYLACLLALLSRFDLSIHTLMRDSGFLPALHAAFPWIAIGMIALFIPLKLYSSLWEFAGVLAADRADALGEFQLRRFEPDEFRQRQLRQLRLDRSTVHALSSRFRYSRS